MYGTPLTDLVVGLQTCFTDLYLTAKVYFDLGEYQRAAHTLEAKVSAALAQLRRGAAAGEGGGAGLNQEELFLRCYSLYLAGEKVRPVLPLLHPPFFSSPLV
jgi:hypothetical protein